MGGRVGWEQMGDGRWREGAEMWRVMGRRPTCAGLHSTGRFRHVGGVAQLIVGVVDGDGPAPDVIAAQCSTGLLSTSPVPASLHLLQLSGQQHSLSSR